METIQFLNVKIDNITQEELLAQLDKGVLVTLNADHVMLCQKNEEFLKNTSRAEYAICDSRVLQLLSKLLKTSLKEAIPGANFFPAYCDYHAQDENIRIFLLGAREGVAEKAKNKINSRIGRELVVGVYSPPFGFEHDEEECKKIVDILQTSTANVIVVGLGNPKQTNWIYKYKDQLPNIDLFMALGATIDFEAGVVRRAPQSIQKMRLEWFYRFMQEPRRLFRRYFVDDVQIFYYFAKQLLGIYKNPFEKK